MHTTATLHVHPKVTDPIRVFEVRHLAEILGCAFIPTKRKAAAPQSPQGPDNGGRAA